MLGRVMGEYEVGRRGLVVTGETGFHGRRGGGFAIYEGSESPSASRGVLRGVLDHELNVRGGTCDERLGLAKDFVVFLRRDVAVVQSRDDCAFGEWKLSFAVGFDRHIVTQNGSNAVEVALLVGDGDQLPVAVSGWNGRYEDGGARNIGVESHGHRKRGNTCQHYDGNQQPGNAFHSSLLQRST